MSAAKPLVPDSDRLTFRPKVRVDEAEAAVPKRRSSGDDLVESAVQHIQALERRHRIAFALQVGAWLFQNVFAGDERFVSSRGRSAPTFARIAADPRLAELGLGRSTLHNFVRLHVQLRSAGPALRESLDQLSLSKQLRLLRLRDPVARQRVAALAARDDWTVREVERAITAELASDRSVAGHEVPGRKPLPQVVIRARHVGRSIDRMLEVVGSLEQVPATERALLTEKIELMAGELAELREDHLAARSHIHTRGHHATLAREQDNDLL